MKQCSKCKKQLEDNDNFCSSCGAELPKHFKEQEVERISRCKKCGEPYPDWIKRMYEMIYETLENIKVE